MSDADDELREKFSLTLKLAETLVRGMDSVVEGDDNGRETVMACALLMVRTHLGEGGLSPKAAERKARRTLARVADVMEDLWNLAQMGDQGGNASKTLN